MLVQSKLKNIPHLEVKNFTLVKITQVKLKLKV